MRSHLGILLSALALVALLAVALLAVAQLDRTAPSSGPGVPGEAGAAMSAPPVAALAVPMAGSPSLIRLGTVDDEQGREVLLAPDLLDPSGPLWLARAPLRLDLPLPDGRILPLSLERLERQRISGVSASGRVPEAAGSLVTLGHHGDALAIVVRNPARGEIWELLTVAPGRYRLRETSGDGAEAGAAASCATVCACPEHVGQSKTLSAEAISHASPIELPLRAFASPALASRLGLSAVAANALNHVAFISTACAGSPGLEQLETTLLHAEIATGFTEQSSYGSDLSTFGQWLHDRYGAPVSSQKVVSWAGHRSSIGCNDSLLMHDKSFSGTVGIAWIGATPAVISGRYSSLWRGNVDFAHEYGHNLGANHDSGGEAGLYIMNSGVTDVTTYSPTSVGSISNRVGNTGNFPIGSYVDTIVDARVDGAASTGPVPFFIGGTDTAGSIAFAASSDTPALIANADIVFGGSDKVRTIEAFLTAGSTGSVDIAVTVTIDGVAHAQTWTVEVVANGAAGDSFVSLATASRTVAEDDGAVAFTVTRTGSTDDAISVAWEAVGAVTDPATPGADFTGTGGTLSWGAGQGGGRTITLGIVDDLTIEGPEHLVLRLKNASGALLGATDQTVVSIADNDFAPPARRISVVELPSHVWSIDPAAAATSSGGSTRFDDLDPGAAHDLAPVPAATQ